MISKDIQKKILGVIREKMIPEYKNSLVYKEKLKEEFVRYLEEDYMTERDRELISKYPDHIKQVDKIPISYYRYYGSGCGEEIKLEHFKDYTMRDDDDMVIKLDKNFPVVCDSIYSLKEIDKKEWKKIGPLLHQFVNARNSYVKKVNIACEFLGHKNTTVTLIKNEFPELYKLYKS